LRAITPDTGLRLSRYFGLSEQFWINKQTRYDLEVEKDRLQGRLDKEVRVYARAAQTSIYATPKRPSMIDGEFPWKGTFNKTIKD
jgi:plasmid maintenance system antidote protein VapI